MKAIRRHLRIAPKKVNLVAGLVRGMSVDKAITILSFTPKRSARPMMEAIKSATANAVTNFKQKRDSLYIQHIIVNEGATLKRSRPISRGRTHPLLKRTSHIRVELMVQTEAPKKFQRKPRKINAEASTTTEKAAPKKPRTSKKSPSA